MASEPVGCVDADIGCNSALTVARDPDGGLWRSNDACIPADWKVEQNEEVIGAEACQ